MVAIYCVLSAFVLLVFSHYANVKVPWGDHSDENTTAFVKVVLTGLAIFGVVCSYWSIQNFNLLK